MRITSSVRVALLGLAFAGCAAAGNPPASLAAAAGPAVSVSHLRCDDLDNPPGIDITRPELAWLLESTRRGESQVAFQVLVASSEAGLKQNRGDLWDSGRVQSSQSAHVTYAGRPLKSGMPCWWKVRVWDQAGRPSGWSKTASWGMGLLKPVDWTARWIGLDEAPGADQLSAAHWIWFPEGDPAASAPVAARYFRRAFTLPAGRTLTRAVCRIAADNSFHLFVNGAQVGQGDDFHSPAVLDVTHLLHQGANVLAVAAANEGDAPNPAGLIAALQVEFTSGTPLTLVTDGQWRASMEMPAGWMQRTFDDSGWAEAKDLGAYGMAPWGKTQSEDARPLPARMLRKELSVKHGVARATAYVCGLGLFELYVDGQRVSDNVLQPALSEYDKTDYYVTFDITRMLKEGKNALGVILGNGRFFAPRLTTPAPTVTFGYPKLLMQVEIQYRDGSTQRIVSDGSWKLTTDGPIRANNEYDGETYDARMEMNGWARPGFNDSAWRHVELVAAPGGILRAQPIDPIRVMQTLHPVAITIPSPGVYIFDMGQNMVGWCRLRVRGPAGATVQLRHAERLRADGTLYTDNLRSAKATDTYILNGQGEEVYEPRFTYHGFRYVEVTGFPGKPTLSAIEGRVVHDSLASTGSFTCSDPLLNQIYHNIWWGTSGNYRSIPTDCPQRDERQGWLGDRSAECWGESFLFDVSRFYAKWVTDIQDCQRPSGSIGDVAPAYWQFYNDGVVWPSTFIIVPQMVYEQYGDTTVLADHYPAMKHWIDYMNGFITDGIMPRNSYGDWCVPPKSPTRIQSQDPARQTPGDLISTAYYYFDLTLMARTATVLNKPDDAAGFQKMADAMKAAFNQRFYRANTTDYGNGSQTSSLLPLAFGMAPPEVKQAVFDALVHKIEVGSAGHIGTGLVGGQWLMQTLSHDGALNLAYHIANQTTYPSWGYMISKGATTMWELWNGDTANPAMNSGNHVMLIGDLTTWLFESLAGIRPDSEHPGFRHIILHPLLPNGLTSVTAHHDTVYGRILSSWTNSGGRFTWDIQVPVNTTATVYVPAASAASVTEGGRPAGQSEAVKFLRMEEGNAVYEIGSGAYHFQSQE